MMIEIVAGVLLLVISTICCWAFIRPKLRPTPKPQLTPSPNPSQKSRPNSSKSQERSKKQVDAYWQRSIISCECAYNGNQVLKLLNEQERGFHDFKQYQLSKELDVHGVKMRYFIAQTRTREVFLSIAVTGCENIAHEHKEFCCHPTGPFKGHVLSFILDVANQIPCEHLLEEFKDKKLIISGHYIGGAVAQLVTILMRRNMRQKNKIINGETIRCIAFGAPQFADRVFSKCTKRTKDDALIENVVTSDDAGWRKNFTPQRSNTKGGWDRVYDILQGVLSGMLKLFKTTTSTPILLGQTHFLDEEPNSGTACDVKDITAYRKIFNIFYDLQKFDPTNVKQENILAHQLQLKLDAEFDEGKLQLKVFGRGFDVLDLSTFEYANDTPGNVKVIERTKAKRDLTLKMDFPVDPHERLQPPFCFTCETHFGKEEKLKYDCEGLPGLVYACPCMTPNGKADWVNVLTQAIRREVFFARFFNESEDGYYDKSEVVKLIEKLTEVTTNKPKAGLKGTVRQSICDIASEERRIDSMQLLEKIREKMGKITITYNRTASQIKLGSFSGIVSVIGIVTQVALLGPVGLPGGIVGGIAAGVAYFTLKKTSKEERQYPAVLALIASDLLSMCPENTVQACNCKLEKKIKDKAISEEYIDECMLFVDQIKLPELPEITDNTRGELSKRLHAVCIICQVREIYLKEIVILVIGQQNHGKTTLVQRLTGQTAPSAEIGLNKHTEKPTLYKYTVDQEDIKLVDMPGSTSISDEIAAFTEKFGKAADLLVWVYQFSGSNDTVFTKELERVKSLNRPFLLCFSKCCYVRDDPGMKHGGEIRDMLPKLKDVKTDQIIPIELMEKKRRKLETIQITGVKSAHDVGQWILEWKRRYQYNRFNKKLIF